MVGRCGGMVTPRPVTQNTTPILADGHCHYGGHSLPRQLLRLDTSQMVDDHLGSLSQRFIYFYFVFMTENNYPSECHMVIVGESPQYLHQPRSY